VAGCKETRACRRAEGRLTGIFFSVIQKKVLTPGGFPGLGTLSCALLAFVNRYNRTARPFKWKFTADDLTALLRRISQYEQAATSQQTDLPQAA
jgi:hypothetical protein